MDDIACHNARRTFKWECHRRHSRRKGHRIPAGLVQLCVLVQFHHVGDESLFVGLTQLVQLVQGELPGRATQSRWLSELLSRGLGRGSAVSFYLSGRDVWREIWREFSGNVMCTKVWCYILAALTPN